MCVSFGNVFHESVGDDGGGVVAHHAVAVAWTGPFGEKTAFEVSVQQPFLHLFAHGGVYQIYEREETTESVPETGIGEHIARQHLAIVGAVVYDLPPGVY